MSMFIDELSKTNGLYTYDVIRSALYAIGLPMDEAFVDEIYEKYTTEGLIPQFLEESLQQITD